MCSSSLYFTVATKRQPTNSGWELNQEGATQGGLVIRIQASQQKSAAAMEEKGNLVKVGKKRERHSVGEFLFRGAQA